MADSEPTPTMQQPSERVSIESQVQAVEVARYCLMALQLANFHAYEPTMYEWNHPMHARVAFTAAVLLQYTPLPDVLCDLIGAYDPAPLPYILDDTPIDAAPLSADSRRTDCGWNSSRVASHSVCR
jgi:hypothetical protein